MAFAPLNAECFASISIPTITDNAQKHIMKEQDEDYILVCNSIFEKHKNIFKVLITKQNDFLGISDNEKQEIKRVIDKLTEVIETAKERIESPNYKDLRNENEKVYYSSLAIKNLLEEIIDEEFMRLTEGVKFVDIENRDILEYGKGIEKAEMALKVFA